MYSRFFLFEKNVNTDRKEKVASYMPVICQLTLLNTLSFLKQFLYCC